MADIQTPLFMKSKTYGISLLILSIIGWLASATLTLERLALYGNANHVASCDFGLFVSCTSLMKTSQAALLGFPNPFIGIVGFAILGTIAVMILMGTKPLRWFWVALQIGVTAAFALVVFFWITSVYTVMTLCPWCMVVWTAVIPLFMLTTAYNVYHGNIFKNPRDKIKNFVSGWWWMLAIMAIVGIIASILFRFAEYIFV